MRLNLNLCKNSTEIARVRCAVSSLLLLCWCGYIADRSRSLPALGRKTNNRKGKKTEVKRREVEKSKSRELSGETRKIHAAKKKESRRIVLFGSGTSYFFSSRFHFHSVGNLLLLTSIFLPTSTTIILCPHRQPSDVYFSCNTKYLCQLISVSRASCTCLF